MIRLFCYNIHIRENKKTDPRNDQVMTHSKLTRAQAEYLASSDEETEVCRVGRNGNMICTRKNKSKSKSKPKSRPKTRPKTRTPPPSYTSRSSTGSDASLLLLLLPIRPHHPRLHPPLTLMKSVAVDGMSLLLWPDTKMENKK